MYKIYDWAGNEMTLFGVFTSFEEADETLDNHVASLLDKSLDSIDWDIEEKDFYIEKGEYQILYFDNL